MTPTLDFTGKRVVVAGGSRGIGRSIALAFAEAGAAVSICARGAEDLAKAREEIAAFGHPVHAEGCDLADGAAVRRYVADAAEALGGLDLLVNNASGFGMGDDEESWSASLAVDVLAAVRASQSALPFLEASEGSSIINISSISGYMASGSPSYGAAKAAMIHYTRNLALQLAPRRVRVNCIAPGSIFFAGGFWDRVQKNDPGTYDSVLKGIPFGRMGKPEEIANTALFLASPLASWITGQTVTVDGGQLLGGG